MKQCPGNLVKKRKGAIHCLWFSVSKFALVSPFKAVTTNAIDQQKMLANLLNQGAVSRTGPSRNQHISVAACGVPPKKVQNNAPFAWKEQQLER